MVLADVAVANAMASFPPQPNCGFRPHSAEDEEEITVTVLVPVQQNQQPYKCGLCGGLFDTLDILDSHVQQHTALRPYQCGYCRVSFETNAELSLHFNTVKHEVIEWISLAEDGVLPSDKGKSSLELTEKSSRAKTLDSVGEDNHEQCRATDEATTGGDVCESALDTYDIQEDSPRTKRQRRTTRTVVGATVRMCDPIMCPTCKQTFQRQIDLKKHSVDKHGDDRPFQCPHCPSRHKQKVHLTYHMNSAHSSHKPHSCPVCGDRFKLRCHLRYHLSSKHQMEPSTVLPRACVLGTGSGTAGQQSAVSGQKQTKETAGQQSAVSGQKQTKETAGGEGSDTLSAAVMGSEGGTATGADESSDIVCPTCGQTFQLQVDLKKHSIMEHYDDRPFQCPHCFLRYKQKIHLTYHINSVHSTRRPLACLVCGDRFKLRGHLKYHLLSKHHIEPSTVLKRPSRRRRAENGSSVSLDAPSAIGGEDEPANSGQAAESRQGRSKPLGDSISTAGEDVGLHHTYTELALKSKTLGLPHTVATASEASMEAESAEACHQFVCPTCTQSFQRAVDLKKHSVEEHSDDRPFQCPHCPSRYKQKVHLTYHMNNAHSTHKPHHCPVCGDRFKLRVHLKYHVSSKHRVEPATVLTRQPRLKGDGVLQAMTLGDLSTPKQVGKDGTRMETAGTTANKDGQNSVMLGTNKQFNKHSKSVGKGNSTGVCDSHVRQKLKCGVCGITFSSYLKLWDHWMCAHSTCQCGEWFEDPSGMDSHRRSAHGPTKQRYRPFVCVVCGAAFGMTRYLRKHIYKLHKKKEHQQQKGTKRKRGRPPAEGGSRLHYKCGLCDATFSSCSQVEDHWESAHNTCECGESFTDPGVMDSHRSSVHGQVNKQNSTFVCTLCGEGFQLAHYLNDHIHRQHKDKSSSPRKHPRRQKMLNKTQNADDDACSVCSNGEKGVPCSSCKAVEDSSTTSPQPGRSVYRTRSAKRQSQQSVGIRVTCSHPDCVNTHNSCEHQDSAMDHAYSLPST